MLSFYIYICLLNKFVIFQNLLLLILCSLLVTLVPGAVCFVKVSSSPLVNHEIQSCSHINSMDRISEESTVSRRISSHQSLFQGTARSHRRSHVPIRQHNGRAVLDPVWFETLRIDKIVAKIR